MAGSLNHIVNRDGAFTMALIENMRDAHEALEECFYVIAALLNAGATMSRDPLKDLNYILDVLNYPRVRALPLLGRRAEDS